MRKLNVMISALMAASISLPATATDGYDDDYFDEYYDRARVISVTPQTERVNVPREECHTEYVRERYSSSNERSLTGPIIGGIAGGLLGSQIGKGNGRVAGAAVGAGVGAIVGDRIDNDGRDRYSYGTRPVERCVAVDNWQTVTRGYLVKYRYNGRTYSTVTDRDPGDTIPVRVAIGNGNRQTVSYYEPIPNHEVYRGPARHANYGHGGKHRHGWKKHHGRHHDHHYRDYW